MALCNLSYAIDPFGNNDTRQTPCNAMEICLYLYDSTIVVAFFFFKHLGVFQLSRSVPGFLEQLLGTHSVEGKVFTVTIKTRKLAWLLGGSVQRYKYSSAFRDNQDVKRIAEFHILT